MTGLFTRCVKNKAHSATREKKVSCHAPWLGAVSSRWRNVIRFCHNPRPALTSKVKEKELPMQGVQLTACEDPKKCRQADRDRRKPERKNDPETKVFLACWK